MERGDLKIKEQTVSGELDLGFSGAATPMTNEFLKFDGTNWRPAIGIPDPITELITANASSAAIINVNADVTWIAIDESMGSLVIPVAPVLGDGTIQGLAKSIAAVPSVSGLDGATPVDISGTSVEDSSGTYSTAMTSGGAGGENIKLIWDGGSSKWFVTNNMGFILS
jgi:hypothetical protein